MTEPLFLTPLFVLLISAAAAVCVIQPIGGCVADAIASVTTTAMAEGGAITGAVLGGLYLPVVMMGLHNSLVPIHIELIRQTGNTPLLPILAMAGAGQVGAALAVLAQTKNPQLKKTILSALPLGFLGVGEPLIYGVTLPLGRPFTGAMLGGAAGGGVIAYLNVGAATIGLSGLPLSAATNNICGCLAGLAAAYIFGFIATRWLGFDDPAE